MRHFGGSNAYPAIGGLTQPWSHYTGSWHQLAAPYTLASLSATPSSATIHQAVAVAALPSPGAGSADGVRAVWGEPEAVTGALGTDTAALVNSAGWVNLSFAGRIATAGGVDSGGACGMIVGVDIAAAGGRLHISLLPHGKRSRGRTAWRRLN